MTEKQNLLVQNSEQFSLTPRNLDEAMNFAEILSKSDLVPKDYKGKPGNILVCVQFGAEIGLKPMQSLQNIAVINGRPCVWGDALLALVQGHSEFEDIEETDNGNMATCIIKRKNRTATKYTFSIEDSKLAQLHRKSGPWAQYPSRMRQMRARGFAIRDAFADVLKGMYSREEAEDIPVETRIDDQAVGDEHLKTRTEFIKDKLKEREQQKIELQADVEPVTVDVEEEIRPCWQDLLNRLINIHNIPPTIWQPWIDKAKVATIEELDNEQAEKCVNFIDSKYGPVEESEESK